MFLSADQLLAHLVGDYIIQSDWMATAKTKQSLAALAHALSYTLPFLFLSTNWKVLLVIAGTHFVIDRWRLARYVCWLKNWLQPRQQTGWIYTLFLVDGGGTHRIERPLEERLLDPVERGQAFKHAGVPLEWSRLREIPLGTRPCPTGGSACEELPRMGHNVPWSECVGTGYSRTRPPWLAVWLLIIADNTMHLICNAAALRWAAGWTP